MRTTRPPLSVARRSAWPVLALLALPVLPVVGGPVQPEALPLAPGAVVERRLGGGEAHAYRVEPGPAGHLLVAVEQRGIDVSVEAQGPDGRSLGTVDVPTGTWGRESILLAAGGSHRVEVRPTQPRAMAGRYEIRVEALAGDTPEARLRIAAEELASRAGQLSAEGTAESRRAALAALTEALPHWRALGRRRDEAECLAVTAALHAALEESQPALAALAEALPLWQALADRGQEAETLTSMGELHRRLGDNEAALARAAEARAVAAAAGDRWREAQALNVIGLVHHRRSDFQTALASYQEAAGLFHAAGDRGAEARVLSNIGGIHDSRGEPRPALATYARALDLLRSAGDRAGEARVLANVAVAHRRLGDLGQALSHYEQALAIIRELGDRAWEARTLTNVGVAYQILGEPARALGYYERALALRRAAGDRRGEASTLSGMGRAYLSMGESGKALDLFAQALELARQTEDRQMEATARSLLGQSRAAAGDPERALVDLDGALALLRGLDSASAEAGALYRIALVRAALGRPEAALSDLAESLAIRRAAGDRAGEAEALTAMARLERSLGRLDEARSHAGEALAAVESIRSTVLAPTLRASFLGSRRQVYELYVDLLMEQSRRDPAAGRDRAALAASERARARSLLDLLSEAGADVAGGLPPELAERERTLRQRLNDHAQRREELLDAPAERQRQAELELTALLAEAESLEAEVRRRSPRYAALTRPSPLGAGEVQELLDPGTLLLEYALGEERSFLWAVTAESIASFELPGRSEVEAAARAAYEEIRALDARAGDPAAGAARRLSRMLLAPVADRLAGQRLVVVPDGALHYVPFAALPLPAAGDGAPLLTRHEVVHLPSASVLALQRRELAGRSPAPKALALLADPVFAARDSRVARAASPTPPAARSPGTPPPGGPSFPRLFATRREAEAIAGLLPAGEVLRALDFRASRATALSGELAGYRIVHFATHGVIDSRTPELSGLVLSLVDERGRPQEGFLGLRDVYGLELAADLVVLSGCETALGREVRGEGLAGLTRGFMYAGAARVVASLWRVEDRATAALMTRFYRAMLVDGLPPAAALRQAQLSMLAEPRWRSPVYWAAFQLQGDWS